MDLDGPPAQSGSNPPAELRIKGSASGNSQRHKSLADRNSEEEEVQSPSQVDPNQKERELKEAALRSKLLKNKRKNSGSQPAEAVE